MLKYAFIGMLVVLIIGLLIGFFTDAHFAQSCTDGILGCLDKTSQSGLLKRMVAALSCVYTNVICIFEKIFGLFI